MRLIGIYGVFLLLLVSCNPPVRNCEDFHEGSFEFTATLNGESHTTTFSRMGDLEISTYLGKIDSASVRWINSCEYVLKNLHPKNRQDEKSIHIKILTTAQDSYTFEYSMVGDSKKSRGVAYKKE